MFKDKIKTIIMHNQKRLLELQVVERNIVIEADANYVFMGPRRAGKTYLLFQVIKRKYNASTIHRVLYLNFEDERLLEMNHNQLDAIIEGYNELFDQKPDIYFDEIQNIDHWEKFVRRLADNDYRIMLTGSNSKMLSKEIATTLGGRFMFREVLPLSFKAYLKYNGLHLQDNYEHTAQRFEIKEYYRQYLNYGGFPELNKFENKRDYLSNLFQTLFYGDIIGRYRIKNEHALKLLVKKLAESVNNETSINRIKNLIKAIGLPVGTATLIEYIGFINESYLIFSIENIATKFVEKESRKKYYFSDNGILMLFLFDQNTKLLENLVYLELRRRYPEIYFYKRNLETDFYIPVNQLLIQVSYAIDNPETRDREIKALKQSIKELEAKKALILTNDTEEKITIGQLTIDVIPVWKWLLK
jgi:predicted AAA+ superfamily ATPase